MKDKTTCLKLIEIVSNYYNIDILNPNILKSRKRVNVIPRQISMYLIDKYLKIGLRYNGEFFNKDHATVIHAKSTINNLICYDKDLNRQLNEIEDIISLNINFGSLIKKEQLIFRIAEKLRRKSISRVANINKILSY